MRILLFLVLFIHCCAFGQSAKKANKLLLAQYAREQQKQDSAYAVFKKSERVHDSLEKAINNKTDLMQSGERTAKRLMFDVHELAGSLKTLEVDLGPAKPRDFGYDEIPKYRESMRPVKEALNAEVKFDQVSGQLQLEGLKKKKQNELLREQIKAYEDRGKSNVLRQQELETNNKKLAALSFKMDSLAAVYESLNTELTSAKTVLFAKWTEVHANYVNKGPKGFPEVYQRIFADAFPLREKTGFKSDNSVHEYVDIPVPAPPVEPKQDPILMVLDEPASFPGGMDAMKTYMAKNLRYPETLKETGISGKVFVKFVVSETGELSNVQVMKGLSGCKECDMEVVRVVKGMPKWIPGKDKGKAVKSYYNLPVMFSAQ